MFIVLTILAIIFSIVAWSYFIICDSAEIGVLSAIAALIMLIAAIGIHCNDIEVGKVDALKSAGVNPLSTEQTYEMSQKELDECKVVIHTFGKTYYFVDKD